MELLARLGDVDERVSLATAEGASPTFRNESVSGCGFLYTVLKPEITGE